MQAAAPPRAAGWTNKSSAPKAGVQPPPLTNDQQSVAARPLPHLHPRELEVVELVARGFTDKEIGGELHVTEGTVGWYLAKIYKKCGLHSRAVLAVRFFESRQLSDSGFRSPSPPA